jgi:AmiR/NasT family two-component response regulator
METGATRAYYRGMVLTSDLRSSATAARERALMLRAEVNRTVARADALVAQSFASAGSARAIHKLRDQVHNLNRAMQSRATIEQAVGIVIASTGKPPDEAFRALVQMSQRTNRKLRDIAAELVASRIHTDQ